MGERALPGAASHSSEQGSEKVKSNKARGRGVVRGKGKSKNLAQLRVRTKAGSKRAKFLLQYNKSSVLNILISTNQSKTRYKSYSIYIQPIRIITILCYTLNPKNYCLDPFCQASRVFSDLWTCSPAEGIVQSRGDCFWPAILLSSRFLVTKVWYLKDGFHFNLAYGFHILKIFC